MNPLLFGQLIYNRRSKNIQWGKYNLLNEVCWENWTATCKRIKLAYFLRPRTKISQEWFKDLNVRPETTKLREENIGSKLFDIYLSNCFWYVSGNRDKSKINKWDYTKLKSFHGVNYQQGKKATYWMAWRMCSAWIVGWAPKKGIRVGIKDEGRKLNKTKRGPLLRNWWWEPPTSI